MPRHYNIRQFKRFVLSCLYLILAIIWNSALDSSRTSAVEAYPVPRLGFCPSGYYASGNYCVPSNKRSGAAVTRSGFCPSGYHASGNYCVANNLTSGKILLKNGFCPNGYHMSGSYCVEN